MSLQHSPSHLFDKNAAIQREIVFLNKTKTKKIWRHTCYTGLCEVIGVDLTISMQVQICSYWPHILIMIILYKGIDDIVVSVFVSMINVMTFIDHSIVKISWHSLIRCSVPVKNIYHTNLLLVNSVALDLYMLYNLFFFCCVLIV